MNAMNREESVPPFSRPLILSLSKGHREPIACPAKALERPVPYEQRESGSEGKHEIALPLKNNK
jgi:hypothetical protein